MRRAGAPNTFGRGGRTSPAQPVPLEEASLLARSSQVLREPRRLAAILLLGLSGGIALAFLAARGPLAGADALAYWASIRFWLGGEDPYVPPPPFMPFPYAPWVLYLFLPWALLPWDMAWLVWRAVNVVGFAWSVAWAYERRPLATAVLVALLGVPLVANLDTGNINVFIVLGVWAAHFLGSRAAGLAWALGAAMKWLPAVLIVFIAPRARLWGMAWLAVFAILTVATWPQTLQQIDVVLNFPRPVRLDYLILIWAAVPWLWSQPWPPDWLRREGAGRRLAAMRRPIDWLRSFFGLTADTSDTSTRAVEDRH